MSNSSTPASPLCALPLVFFHDRDVLGRIVRDAWIAWAIRQPRPKPTWLLPYEELSESDKEADRQIGEAVQQAILEASLRHAALANRGAEGDVVGNSQLTVTRPMPDPKSIPWPAVIAIAGHARSGKSTLATCVSDRLGVPSASFGEEVRRIAAERGLSADLAATEREMLMGLGEELVERNLEEFCRRVLGQVRWMPGKAVVVEGVRHRAIAEELRRLVAPMPLFLVIVHTPAEVRGERLANEGAGPMTRAAMDTHSTEREVSGRLASEADLVLDGTGDVSANVDRVVAALRLPA